MSILKQDHPAGFSIFTLDSGDSRVKVSSFGGQILSWMKGDDPIVFENAGRAVLDGATPYRGGAPVCFPHFGQGTLMPLGTVLKPQHGGARTAIWKSEVRDSENAVVLSTEQRSSDGYGPTEFSLELIYRLSDELSISATVRNVGDNEAPFQLAIHTYWATSAPANAVAEGLGNRYLDNLFGLAEHTEPDSAVPHPTPVDRVYIDATQDLVLTVERHRIMIETIGCSEAVLWNPGTNHTISDLGSPDFICLESGLIVPAKRLSPRQEDGILISYRAD
jgi:glucose-6-phosphate 1-epimerase